MVLLFEKAMKESEIKAIYDHTIDAFSDSPDFHWNLAEIKREVKEGWDLYSVKAEDEIVAAIFLKEEKGSLLSKHTAIKMAYQGGGISHEIKNFIESEARKRGLKEILHYCRIDNFRMYSLNEGHGYEKREGVSEDHIVEWVKKIKK